MSARTYLIAFANGITYEWMPNKGKFVVARAEKAHAKNGRKKVVTA